MAHHGGGTLTLTCCGCSGLFTRFASGVRDASASYCSRDCVIKSKTVERVCKHCDKSFVAQLGRLSGKTNSSANFCGRECYWASMRKEVKAPTLVGAAWRRLSAEVIKRTPFCGCCGKSRAGWKRTTSCRVALAAPTTNRTSSRFVLRATSSWSHRPSKWKSWALRRRRWGGSCPSACVTANS